jgi:uncharacterized protein involved in exopolysaccharide biosynthesis
MLLGSTYVIGLPDQYEVSSRIYVDAESLMGPVLKGIAFQDDPTQQLAVMQATLLSRPNLLKVARSAGDLEAQNNEVQSEGVLNRISSNTTVEVTGSSLFKITYIDQDPRRAKAIVQAFLDIFVENNRGKDRDDMENVRSFIDKQIAGYEAQLRATEKRKADFRAKYSDIIPSSGAPYAERLEKARAEVDEASAELAAARNRKDRFAERLEKAPQLSKGNSPEDEDDEDKDPTVTSVVELRAELNKKLGIYTDQHPDVIALKRQLASLEAQNTDSGIAVSEQRLAAAKDALKRLQDMASSAPLLEAQMADMNRDYDILKQKYDELRVRAESARISQDAKDNAEAGRFRIVEPPHVPVAPSGPKRSLFLIAVLCASIGGGIGIAWLLSEMDDSFATPQRLRETFDLPLLGTVCWIPSEADKAKRSFDAMSVSVGAGAMVVFCGVLIALTTHLVDLRDLTQGFFGAGL